jgi:hypothetical protein
MHTCKLKWYKRKVWACLGGTGVERSKELTEGRQWRAAADGVFSGARGKRKGKFYMRVEVVPPHRRGLQELQHGRGAAATCGGAHGQ